MRGFRCVQCASVAGSDDLDPVCARCGGPVLLLKREQISLTRSQLEASPAGVWRYAPFLPGLAREDIVSLGEGGTPLLQSERLGVELGLRHLMIKDESRNPTGSVMDRGSTVLLSLAKRGGIRECECDTTGNLGASLAAYCAKAGVRAAIRVHPNVDRGKLYQMLAYGAEIEPEQRRNGPSRRHGSLQVSAGNPFILEGEKTTGFEVVHELDWKIPDVIVVPMGTGGHLTMIWRAICELRAAGLAEGGCRLLGVRLGTPFGGQGSRRRARNEADFPLAELESEPLFGAEAAASVAESRGATLGVTPKDMIDATGLLARTEGIFAEPSASSVVAAIEVALEGGHIDRSETVVCIITGAGLKDTKSVMKLAKEARTPGAGIPFAGATPAMGKTKVALLGMLREGPGYGYELRMKLSVDRAISTASVYQHLAELVEAGMVRRKGTVAAKGRERVVYEITGRGAELLKLAGRLEELAAARPGDRTSHQAPAQNVDTSRPTR